MKRSSDSPADAHRNQPLKEAARLARKMSVSLRDKTIEGDAMTDEMRNSPHFLLALVLLLDYSNWSVRASAMYEIIRQDPRLGLIASRALAFDPSESMRGAASMQLLDALCSRAEKLLLALLSDPAWTVRSDAVQALGDMASHRTVRSVENTIRTIKHVLSSDRHPVVRRDAAGSLYVAMEAEGMPFLLERLGVERDPSARTGLFSALDAAGHPEALGWWLDLLPSLNCLDQQYAMSSLPHARFLTDQMSRVLEILTRPDEQWACYGALLEARDTLRKIEAGSAAAQKEPTTG